jgi:hypothetical protein
MGSIIVPSTSSTTAILSILAVPISEKLMKSNYPLWSAQVMPPLRAAQLEDLVTGAEKPPEKTIDVVVDGKTVNQPNPAYTNWVIRDQAVLGYLLASLTRETMLHVARCPTSTDVWSLLSDLYASQSRARSVNTRIALATTKKNHLSVSDYYAKMCTYADELAASGAPLRDDELIAYILVDLNEDFNPVFTAVVARVDPIKPSELYSQLLSFEHHTNLQANSSTGGSSSAMSASRSPGLGAGRAPAGYARGCGRGWACGRGHGGSSNRGGGSGNSSRPECQICGNLGHRAKTCWYRYDEDDAPEQRTAAAATTGANNWYTDFGATDHITGDLDRLTMHEPYTSNDQVQVANGSGMDINRIGKTIIPTSDRDLVLNHVLHVPSAHKNLISVHLFTLDNDTFIEFHPYLFLIKDRKTKKVLLHGPCRGGLYPLPPFTSKFRKLVFSAIKISSHRWHSRLGHPSRDIVRRVVSKNNLPCASFVVLMSLFVMHVLVTRHISYHIVSPLVGRPLL